MRIPIRVVLVLGALAVLLVSVGVVRGDLRPPGATQASPSATATSAPVVPRTPATVDGALGCLGGEDAETAAPAAQRSAPLTAIGAAEFAATLARWEWIYPRKQAPAVAGAKLWARDATAAMRTPQWPDARNGDTAYASFIEGHYYIESFTTDTAVVSVQFTTVYTSAGGKMDTHYSTVKVTLEAAAGHWVLKDATGQRPAQEVISLGRPYLRGC